MFDRLNEHLTAAPWWMQFLAVAALMIPAAGGLTLALLAALWLRRAARAARTATAQWPIGRVLITVGVLAAAVIAVVGGVRSYEAVSLRFDDPLVPATADGMILACTALRMAALTRGWRLPGILVTTYAFIGGTVVLNVSAATDPYDVIAHALAPLSFALLQEYLAHFLRLHLRLARPARPRVTALVWATSPVVTTRVWLHLARTGGDDPVAARLLIQQCLRMASRLRAVCPSGRWPLDGARSARAAALQTIRDGLLSAAELAAQLPAGDRLEPGELLAIVDGAALTRTTLPTTGAPHDRTSGAPVHRTDPAPVALTGAPDPVHTDRTGDPAPPAPIDPAPVSPSEPHRSGRGERTDDELVAEIRAHASASGGPLSQREVMRLLGCGTPKAKRLVELAGWLDPAGAARGGASGGGAAGVRREHPQLQIVAVNATEDPENTPDEADTSDESEEIESRTTR